MLFELVILFVILFLFLGYPISKAWDSFQSKKENSSSILKFEPQEILSMGLSYFIFGLGIMWNANDVRAGIPLHKFEKNGMMSDQYASLAHDHIAIVVLLVILGGVSYWRLTTGLIKLSPIFYIFYSTLMIVNIVYTFIYITHTGFAFYTELGGLRYIPVFCIQVGMLAFSLLFLAKLRNTLGYFIQSQNEKDYTQSNRIILLLYRISFGYQKMATVWMISLFPVLLIVQFILILFGQKPDSFIRVFMETSSFNYSKIPAPSPQIVSGDGHYLCTVSVKGHKNIVKPLRAGIRHGERITVNRQLLIANAFENVIEERVPKCHKVIRNFYDKYGYPISKHINTKWSADFVYILMKPLEWFFLFVLYTVDKNPENRIHIQYSELRK